MNGHSLLLMAALLTSAMPAQAQTQDPPLFSAFKAYCLKAGGDADQIKLAVEMRGGKPANHPSGITATPWPMTATNWDNRTGPQDELICRHVASGERSCHDQLRNQQL